MEKYAVQNAYAEFFRVLISNESTSGKHPPFEQSYDKMLINKCSSKVFKVRDPIT